MEPQIIFSSEQLREMYPEHHDLWELCDVSGAITDLDLRESLEIAELSTSYPFIQYLLGLNQEDAGTQEPSTADRIAHAESILEANNTRMPTYTVLRRTPDGKVVADEDRSENKIPSHLFPFNLNVILKYLYSINPGLDVFSRYLVAGSQDIKSLMYYEFSRFHFDVLNPAKASQYIKGNATASAYRNLLEGILRLNNDDAFQRLNDDLDYIARNSFAKGNKGKIALRKQSALLENQTDERYDASAVVDHLKQRGIEFPELNDIIQSTHKLAITTLNYIYYKSKRRNGDSLFIENLESQMRSTFVTYCINMNQVYDQPEERVDEFVQYMFGDCGFQSLMKVLNIPGVDGFVNGLKGEIRAYFIAKKRLPNSWITAGNELDRQGADLVVYPDKDNQEKPIELVQVKNDAQAIQSREYSLQILPVEIATAMQQNGRKLKIEEIQALRTRIFTLYENGATLSDADQLLHSLFVKAQSSSNYSPQRLAQEIDTLVKLAYQADQYSCKATWIVTNENS